MTAFLKLFAMFVVGPALLIYGLGLIVMFVGWLPVIVIVLVGAFLAKVIRDH